MHTAHLSHANPAYHCFDVTLPKACAHDVIRSVQHVADAATEMMHISAFRPQYGALYVAELTPEIRPATVRKSPHRLIGIFSQLPTYGNPTGTRLFVVGFLDDCRCGGSCQGQRQGPLQVQVRWVSGFPLEVHEAHYEFCRCFGNVPWQECGTHPVWMPTAEPLAALASPAARRQAGAPFAVPTQKLLHAIEQLDDIYDNRHLKPDYLAWYMEHNDREPADKDGSFRKAVQICIRTLEARRSRFRPPLNPQTR